MSEPIYEFIKGQGWVVTLRNIIFKKDRHGTPICIEMRAPKEGEHFFFGYPEERMPDNIKYARQH